jgi:hypothetical protein
MSAIRQACVPKSIATTTIASSTCCLGDFAAGVVVEPGETVIHPLGIGHRVEALLDSHGLKFKAPIPGRAPSDSVAAIEKNGR